MAKRRRQCATMQVFEELSESVPSFRANQLRIHEDTQRSIETGRAQQVMRRQITIPVVVHVVYRTQAENISKTQINSQISVLNKDFAASNSDVGDVPAAWSGLVGNCEDQIQARDQGPQRDSPPMGSRGLRRTAPPSRQTGIR